MPYLNEKQIMGIGEVTILPPDMNDYYTKDEVDEKIDNIETGGNADLSGVASAIQNTISGGKESLTVNDVSPLAHKCSLRLTSDMSRNIYIFDNSNMVISDDYSASLITTYNDNGTVTFNGHTDGNGVDLGIYLRGLTAGNTYTFSIEPPLIKCIELCYKNGEAETIGDYSENSFTFTVPENLDYYFITCGSFGADEEMPLNDYTFYPQLELGTEAHEWQEYGSLIADFTKVKINVNGTTYTPNADGTVTDIASVPPTMEITTDNEHVNICDFTYCADTKRYIDAEPKYELIDTITITEAVKTLNLNLPYNCKKLFIKYTLPKLSAKIWLTFRINNVAFGDYMGDTGYATVYRFETKVENGLLSADFSYHTNHASNPSNTWKCLARDIITTPINNITLTTDPAIPVGATFEIWGLRA